MTRPSVPVIQPGTDPAAASTSTRVLGGRVGRHAMDALIVKTSVGRVRGAAMNTWPLVCSLWLIAWAIALKINAPSAWWIVAALAVPTIYVCTLACSNPAKNETRAHLFATVWTLLGVGTILAVARLALWAAGAA